MDLCALLQEVGLAQFAGATAATADLANLCTLSLTDPACVRTWLRAELGVVKLGHRERILNALRRKPSSTVVAVGNESKTASTHRPHQISHTGVFIGDPALLRPLPALGEAGMHIDGWSLAETTDSRDNVNDSKYLLCSHISGTQVLFPSMSANVWLRRRGNRSTGAIMQASQPLGRFSSGARLSMASGKITPADMPCVGEFGRLESGVRRPLGRGAFQWMNGRQVLTNVPGNVLGITALPRSKNEQYTAGPVLWLTPDGGVALHDGMNRLMQLHVPLLDATAAALRRLAWAWVSELLPPCIRVAVADKLRGADVNSARARVQHAEVALAVSSAVQLADNGCGASNNGDHGAALRYYLAAADWVQWIGGEAARRHSPPKLLLRVTEGLQRATVQAAAAEAATEAVATCDTANCVRRPSWVWPVTSHRLQHQCGEHDGNADVSSNPEAKVCQRCFSDSASDCTLDIRTGKYLCAVCSGDTPDVHRTTMSETATFDSMLAADSECPPHFAMLSCYAGGVSGSMEPVLINQWKSPGVCACCGPCGRLMLPQCRLGEAKVTHTQAVPVDQSVLPAASSSAATGSQHGDIFVPVPPPACRYTTGFFQARNGLLRETDIKPVQLGTHSSIAWLFGQWLVQCAPLTLHHGRSPVGNSDENGGDDSDGEEDHEGSQAVQQLMLAHSDGKTRLTIILLPPLADENHGKSPATSARRQRYYDQHRRLQNDLFGPAHQQWQRQDRLHANKSGGAAYIFCQHADGSASITMASTGLTQTLDLTAADDQMLKPTTTVDAGPTVVRLPGGQYSWQWRRKDFAHEPSPPARDVSARPGSGWHQRRPSAQRRSKWSNSGAPVDQHSPCLKQDADSRSAEMVRLHVCEHSSRLHLFGGSRGRTHRGASLFFTDDGSVALHTSAVESDGGTGFHFNLGIRSRVHAEMLPRPPQFLHVSVQLPIAQRLAWATLLLSSAKNTASVAHKLLSPDLIELIGRQVADATGQQGHHGARKSSTSAVRLGQRAQSAEQTRCLEHSAVAKGAAVRQLAERLWRRSCWWSDFYRQEESAMELARALHHEASEGAAARLRRDRQVAAAQAVLWERVLGGDTSIPFTENGFDIPIHEQLRLARASRPLS